MGNCFFCLEHEKIIKKKLLSKLEDNIDALQPQLHTEKTKLDDLYDKKDTLELWLIFLKDSKVYNVAMQWCRVPSMNNSTKFKLNNKAKSKEFSFKVVDEALTRFHEGGHPEVAEITIRKNFLAIVNQIKKRQKIYDSIYAHLDKLSEHQASLEQAERSVTLVSIGQDMIKSGRGVLQSLDKDEVEKIASTAQVLRQENDEISASLAMSNSTEDEELLDDFMNNALSYIGSNTPEIKLETPIELKQKPSILGTIKEKTNSLPKIATKTNSQKYKQMELETVYAIE